MTAITSFVTALKIAAQQAPPAGGPPAPSMPNPVQQVLQQRQAVAEGGGAMPQGNPEIMKAQEQAMQASQQAAQQVESLRQQAGQEVMQANQQMQQETARLRQEAQGQIDKLHDQLDNARNQVVAAKTDAQIARLEKRQAELEGSAPKDPEPQAPDPRPTLKRLQGRIGKALSRLDRVEPALKLAVLSLPHLAPDAAGTVPSAGAPAERTWQDSPGYNNPAAGQLLQHTGYTHGGIYSPPSIRPTFGVIGDKMHNMARDFLWAKPDYDKLLAYPGGLLRSDNPYSLPYSELAPPNYYARPQWENAVGSLLGGLFNGGTNGGPV